MAEIINRDKRDGYIYDPVVKGYDTTFWKSVTGTPTISSSKVRFNAQEAASFLLHIYADLEFLMNVPAAPTSGDVRSFGFRDPSGNTRGAIFFDITGTTFSIKVFDDAGTSFTKAITWNVGWSAVATAFRIRWERDHINVYVGGTLQTSIAVTSIVPPSGPLAIDINNGNSDNMDMTYMLIRRAASII